MATKTLYLKACDFSAWINGGEDYATFATNDRNIKGQFNGAGLNLTQYKITSIGIYGDYRRNSTLIYPMGNTKRGATLYDGSSIGSIGSYVDNKWDASSKMNGDYAGFTNYYTADTNIINRLTNQINNGLVVTIDLHADNTGSATSYRIYGKNIRLVVAYEEKPKYTVTVSTSTGGTVTGNGTYYSGTTATLSATPNSGYRFKQWSDGNTSATRTVTVTGNATYTAIFEPITYTIKYVDSAGTDSVSASFGQEVAARAIRDKNITITYDEASSRGKTESYKLPVRGWKDSNSIVAKDGNTYTIDNFDAPFYANKHSDLYNAFGYNKYSLINHYIDWGLNEGRQCKPNNGEPCGVYLQDRPISSLSTTHGQEIVLEAVYEDSVLVTIGDISKSGYVFKGWQSPEHTELLQPGTQVYFTADATLTAVWEQIQTYYLDLNGRLDGVSSGGIAPYGTADVYINGSLVSEGCGDFWTAYPVGTTYEIKNIKANDGYQYDGVYSGSVSGTITGTTYVVLSFSTVVVPPRINSVSLIYAGAQVSENNKVPAGEYCILSVVVT